MRDSKGLQVLWQCEEKRWGYRGRENPALNGVFSPHNITSKARQEYRLMSTFEMDIKDRVKRETAKLMKNRGYPISEILLITSLPESEIEEL